MLCLWVQMRDSCDPGGYRMARGWRYTKLSLYIETSSSIIFWYVLCFIVPFFLFLFSFSCSPWSFVDVSLTFSCPADHVPDWQLRIYIGYG